MALIKCPECNREFSEDKESCPMCGFKIKEFNQQAEKQQKKDANVGIIKKIVIGIIAVILIIVAINIISAIRNYNLFKQKLTSLLQIGIR